MYREFVLEPVIVGESGKRESGKAETGAVTKSRKPLKRLGRTGHWGRTGLKPRC